MKLLYEVTNVSKLMMLVYSICVCFYMVLEFISHYLLSKRRTHFLAVYIMLILPNSVYYKFCGSRRYEYILLSRGKTFVTIYFLVINCIFF